MNKFYSFTTRLSAVLALSLTAIAANATAAAPVDLNASVNGTRVDLKWVNGDLGTPLLDCGFEEETFPPAGWTTKVTNNYAYLCSWFKFPTPDFAQATNYEEYIHSGESSAMVYFDLYSMKGDHNSAQDEWLITPALPEAAYVDLYYYIDPMILEYGTDEAFPDHYYVKVSYDDGATWSNLWDAPKDASSTPGWNRLSLPLQGTGTAKVAFQTISDEGQTVHFLWGLDDVKVNGSKSGTVVEGYTVKLDGEIIAEHLHSVEFTDRTPKAAGKHVYEVFAESGGTLSAAATTEVTIEEIELLPPTNVRIESNYDEFSESYAISLEWEAPVGGVKAPSYYNVYCDGLSIGTELEETAIEFWGYNNGIYDFKVTAVYTDPDGESEAIGKRIALNTRYNGFNLKVTPDGNNVKLSWEAPEAQEAEVDGYILWRGDKNIAEKITELTFEDKDVPAGLYRYTVVTLFKDGVKSMPAYADYDNGTAAPVTLPFSENFDAGFLPGNWRVVNFWDITPANLLWQFGDPNGIGVKGEGFDNGFASIDCINSGFYALESTLETPSISIEGCTPENLILSFAYDYASAGFDSEAYVEIETDDSGDWQLATTLESYDPTMLNGFAPTTITCPLEMTEGASTIRLRWHYTGMFDYHLAIDNVKVYDKTASVSDILDDDVNAPVEYFNLQGIKVENPSNGIFIRRQGNKTAKVVVN